MAMVFQQFGLLPWRIVRANFGLGLKLAGVTGEERISAQFELVGLIDRADAKVAELSGGMRQRFIAQINPLQVLTAEDILAHSTLTTQQNADAPSQPADTPASVIMSLLHEHDGPLTITRDSRQLGQIDRTALLACLASYNRK